MLRETRSQSVGVSISVAGRLATGLEQLKLGSVDLVLLDLSIPDSSGLETFKSLHAAAPGTTTAFPTGSRIHLLRLRATMLTRSFCLDSDHVPHSRA